MLLFFFWFDKIVNIFPSWGVYVDGYGYILDAAIIVTSILQQSESCNCLA